MPTFALCDAAEVFIFISGYAAALVYGRVMAHQGMLFATARIYKRAWQLYVTHLCLFMLFTAEVSYTVQRFNNPMYNDELRVGDFLAEPDIAVIKALVLQFQPTFLDILPLYIALLLVLPLILLGLRRFKLFTLVPAVALYAAVQVWDLNLSAYPEGATWHFNPLAWQFLFITGAVLGQTARRGRSLGGLSRLLMPVAIGVLAVAVTVRLSWTLGGLWDQIPTLLLKELWPVNKTDLSPVRLAPFLATVVLVASWVRPDAPFLRSRVARPFVLCGRQSLEVFCLGIVLSALGHFILAEYESGLAMQVAVNAVGIGLMLGTGKMIDWYKEIDRVSAPGLAGGPDAATRPRCETRGLGRRPGGRRIRPSRSPACASRRGHGAGRRGRRLRGAAVELTQDDKPLPHPRRAARRRNR